MKARRPGRQAYAYHLGLIKAQRHLEKLGAPFPEVAPFDESKFEPVPEVEMDRNDELQVGADDTN